MSQFSLSRRATAKRLRQALGGVRYRELRELGSGGLARVSAAFDTYLNRSVALKRLHAHSASQPHLMQAFMNEARILGFLEHPGIVPLYDTFLDKDGELCYTMKILEGETLQDLLEGTLDPAQATEQLVRCFDIFTRVCQTMAFAHSRGVLHLDLKPANVMLGRFGEVLIVDWGNAVVFSCEELSRQLRRQGVDATTQWREPFGGDHPDQVVGTPAYMSPEQTCSPRTELGPPSDVFSAGTVLYQMLTGILPFDAPEPEESMELVRRYDPRAPHEVNPEVPRRLSAICMRMLCKERDERYGGFDAIVADMHEFRTAGITFLNRTFGTGEIIFREGDDGNYSLAIIAGRVEITRLVDGTPRVLAVLGAGEIVGELAIISHSPRSATARALEPTTVRIMSRRSIEQELEKLSPWVGEMIDTLCTRFIDLNNRMALLQQ